MSMGNSRITALFALCLILFGIGQASAAWPTDFSNVTNFHNAQNFTNFANGTFYGQTQGKMNYAYLTINNLAFVTSKGWLFRGYNGSVFVGNVSAYPYQFGFLVPLHTMKGKAYNTLALFSNQSVTNVTSSMRDDYLNITTDENTVKYSFYQYLLGVQGNAYRINFTGCSYVNNQTCSWNFYPKQPYFLIETSTYPNQNVSVDYINYGGIQEAALTADSSIVSIRGKESAGDRLRNR